MTELQVLQKLERAYSRKWWQFWIERPKSNGVGDLWYMMFQICFPDKMLYINTSMLIHNQINILNEPILPTIRAAIKRLKEQK